MFLVVADLVILALCVGLNWWAIRKEIRQSLALNSEGLPNGQVRAPLSSHIAWILAAGVLYANLPFNEFVNLGIGIVLLFAGIAIQDRIVNSYVSKKVAELTPPVQKKHLTKSERKRKNREARRGSKQS